LSAVFTQAEMHIREKIDRIAVSDVFLTIKGAFIPCLPTIINVKNAE
jgi:hypothetical protein